MFSLVSFVSSRFSTIFSVASLVFLLTACSEPSESPTKKPSENQETGAPSVSKKPSKPTLSLSERAKKRILQKEREKRENTPPKPAPVQTDDSSFDERVKKHGMNAVVRPKRAFSRKPIVLPIPSKTNDADHPVALEFRQIKANYQYFVVKGSFHPEGLPRLNGAVVEIKGAIMPIDPPGKDGKMSRFWLANPSVVQAGCVFCNPPGLDDLIYVTVEGDPLEVDRERLYRSVLTGNLKGRLTIRSTRSRDGFEYLLGITMDDIEF